MAKQRMGKVVQDDEGNQRVEFYDEDVPDDLVATQSNEAVLRDRADQAIDQLRTLATSTGTLTGAQLSTGLRLAARVLLVLIRLHLRRLDATD